MNASLEGGERFLLHGHRLLGSIALPTFGTPGAGILESVWQWPVLLEL